MAPAKPKRSAFGRFMRVLGLLLLIAVLAAIIAGTVLLVTDAGQSTDVGDAIKDSINDQLNTLREIIEQRSQ